MYMSGFAAGALEANIHTTPDAPLLRKSFLWKDIAIFVRKTLDGDWEIS